MATVKSGINKVGNNYYQSITKEESDGSVGTTFFRVNADGSGGVPIYDVDKAAGSTSLSKSFDPNATAEEKRLLSDPNSQLSKVRAQQVTSSNPNATATQRSTLAQAGGGSGNNATSTQSTDQQTGSSPTDFNQTLSNLKVGDKAGGVRQSYGNYKYPRDANFGLQDCIKFSMYRYKPKKVELSSDLGSFSGSNKGSALGTATLPIQPGISDSNVVSWGENSMDAISAAGSAAALAAIKGGAEGAGEAAETATKGVADYKGDIQKAIAASFAGAATGANQGFLTRATGAVLNNNLELLFQGPSLRSFTFTFSMSARFKEEAEEIRKIIRFFKQGMSVKRSESALFLQTPNIFDIQYLHKGKEHPYINQIKTCALQNLVVNYTPAGNYATYDDGAMTQYDMTLTFGEIEPLFDDDYGQSDDGKIGY
jgi:hypothetical protein